MAFRWRADDGPTLNAGLVAVIFQGIRTNIIKKHYTFVIFHVNCFSLLLFQILSLVYLEEKIQRTAKKTVVTSLVRCLDQVVIVRP